MNEPVIPNEKDLLQRLRRGDYGAFEEIYHLYKRRIAFNLFRLLKSRELVDEVLQDLFMKLWEKRKDIDPEQSIKPWLFKVGENLVIDVFRRSARDQKMRAHLKAALSEAYTHIEEDLYRQENRNKLYGIIGQLPPQRRRVFVLCKLESKTYEEVSDLLDISTAAVNDHIRKANLFLRQYVSKTSAVVQVLIAGVLLQGIG